MPTEQIPSRRRRIAGERTRRADDRPDDGPDDSAPPPGPSAAPAPPAATPPPGPEPAAEQPGVVRRPRLSMPAVVVLAVLAAVTALALVLAGRLWLEAQDQNDIASARDEASSAAQDAAGPVLSIQRNDIEGSAETARSFMTDDYADDYQDGIDKLIAGATEETGRSITRQRQRGRGGAVR